MTTDINMATDMGTDIDKDMDVKKYHKNADRILLQHTVEHVLCVIVFSGYGSTDLRLDTSTKLKMVNYWWY